LAGGSTPRVAEGQISATDRLGGLVDGNRFTRQRRLVHQHGYGRQEAAIGRHPVTRVEQHDVARHHRVGGDLHHRAAAANPGAGDEHVAQRRHRVLRPALLDEPKSTVDQQDDAHHRRILEIPERGREAGGAGQDRHQDAAELVHEPAPRGPTRRLSQPVRPEPLQPFRGIPNGEPRRRVDPERVAHVVSGSAVGVTAEERDAV